MDRQKKRRYKCRGCGKFFREDAQIKGPGKRRFPKEVPSEAPTSINIPQSAQALPRTVQIRARYVIGNDDVGQYSDIDSISTIP
jgi:hypothetical protein